MIDGFRDAWRERRIRFVILTIFAIAV